MTVRPSTRPRSLNCYGITLASDKARLARVVTIMANVLDALTENRSTGSNATATASAPTMVKTCATTAQGMAASPKWAAAR